ncbi:endoribonuclease L-PSP family protein [Burkholderia thailandensis MSMB121]|uniref:RidA family protein n=2 Tax=Burkholderia humptydooensis TaxID=430531 RepID=A0A7U4PBX9_9BURK|nr:MULTISPECIES: RidA family protein [Burkholderia]AGK49941.1 endoribonuclease L-PSP family protein [Burkholderia thailandensis MSMB121]ATF33594.1 RidA family protein [Burkholderia thailandensis]AJY39230.1 endoribonuclease L-PSP family protein [Burkholderia sp. 2002721687]ALX46721.1 enamine deaminase RidA [Burkholderia humptydooensis]EIP86173.1 putative endoribonuclease L-PSP [Burkholderia humptydooensis MSMB43]
MTIFTAIHPAGHSRPIGKYSPAVAVPIGAGRRLLFISGQVATDAGGAVLAPGDARAQTEIIFERLTSILHTAGGDLSALVSVVIYLRDIADFPAVSAVRNRVLAAPPPASTLVQVASLAEAGCVVEISGVAVIGEDGERG